MCSLKLEDHRATQQTHIDACRYDSKQTSVKMRKQITFVGLAATLQKASSKLNAKHCET